MKTSQIILYILILLSLSFSLFELLNPSSMILVNKSLITSNQSSAPIVNKSSQLQNTANPIVSDIYVPAVEPNGQGVMILISVSRISGTGGIVVNDTNNLSTLGFTTQQSIYNASIAARELSGVNTYDLVYSFNSSNFYLDGPSAGVAMAVASWSALTGIPLRSDTTLTGAIDSNGSVYGVGDLVSKAKAAKKFGFNNFLVPLGQSNVPVLVNTCKPTNCTTNWMYQSLSSVASINVIPYSTLQQAVMQMTFS